MGKVKTKRTRGKFLKRAFELLEKAGGRKPTKKPKSRDEAYGALMLGLSEAALEAHAGGEHLDDLYLKTAACSVMSLLAALRRTEAPETFLMMLSTMTRLQADAAIAKSLGPDLLLEEVP